MAMPLRLVAILGVAWILIGCGSSANPSSISSSGGNASVSSIGDGGLDAHRGAVGSSGGDSSAYPSGGALATGEGGDTGTRGSLPTSLGGNKDLGGYIAQTGGTATVVGTPTGGRSTTGGAGPGGSATGGATLSTAVLGGQSTAGGASGSTAAGGATGGIATGGTSSVSTAVGGACSAGTPLTGGTQHCTRDSGSYGPYVWRLWSNTENSCMTTYSDGAFSAHWNGIGDVLAGVGFAFDSTKTHQELGSFFADFAESKTGSAGNYSYIGVHGFTEDPVAELFIIDDSFQAPPLKPWDSQLMGTLSVDGGNYDIYKSMTLSDGPKPSFINAYSVRQEHRSCGHISISAHLSKWEELGMKLGKLERVEVFVESAGGTGSVDFSTVKVTLD